MPTSSPATKTVFEPSPPASGAVLTPGLLIGGMLRAWNLGFVIIGTFLVLGLVYVSIRHPPYVATAIIEPPISTGPQLSGGAQVLASFAGIESGGSAGAQFTKYLQVIGSTRFAERMDRDHGVMKILMKGWDPRTQSWTRPSGTLIDIKAGIKSALGMPPWTPPDAATLADQLHALIGISLVPGKSPLDLRSQVFAISVRDEDKGLALNLLTWTLRTADDIVREDQLARTINRVAYLKQQIDTTQEVYLRQSLQSILIQQEEMLMTLQADKYFAVDIVDLPSVSDKPVGTSSLAILFAMGFLGLLIYAGAVAYMLFQRLRNSRQAGVDPLRAPFPDPVSSAVGRLRAVFA